MSKFTFEYEQSELDPVQIRLLNSYGITEWNSSLTALNEISSGPWEICSGAVEQSRVHADIFDVQANTRKGPFALYGVRRDKVSENDLREFLDDMQRRYRPVRLGRSTFTTSLVFVASSTVSPKSSEDPSPQVTSSNPTVRTEICGLSPDELIAKLQNGQTSNDERLEAVLFAEIAIFDVDQIERLVPLLFAFVQSNRFSRDETVTTAVGSAIRKLALNLPDSRIEEYSELFLPTDTDTLPCEVELELAKAVVWRLSESRATRVESFPKLAFRLTELACDYLRPRIILHRNYASTAINAVLGVLLLNGEQASNLVDRIKNLGIDWFSDLFRRRLERLQVELDSRDNVLETSGKLSSFVAQFKGATDSTSCQRGD